MVVPEVRAKYHIHGNQVSTASSTCFKSIGRSPSDVMSLHLQMSADPHTGLNGNVEMSTANGFNSGIITNPLQVPSVSR